MNNMNDLIKKISEHEGLYDAILDIQRQEANGKLTKSEYADKLVSLLHNAGIELESQIIEEFTAKCGDVELSDDELENVAGGGLGLCPECDHICGQKQWEPCPQHCAL